MSEDVLLSLNEAGQLVVLGQVDAYRLSFGHISSLNSKQPIFRSRLVSLKRFPDGSEPTDYVEVFYPDELDWVKVHKNHLPPAVKLYFVLGD